MAEVCTEKEGRKLSDEVSWKWYDHVRLKTQQIENVELDQFNRKSEEVFLSVSESDYVVISEEELVGVVNTLEDDSNTVRMGGYIHG